MGGAGTREIRLPRPAGGPAPWLVGAGLAGLALLTVVTASGPVDVVSQPRSATGTATPPPPPSAPTTSPTETLPTTGWFGDLSQLPTLPPAVVALIQLVVTGLCLWVLYLIFRYAWRNTPRMSSRTVPRRSLQALPAVPDELIESAAARTALLKAGEPRNAIVACWVDLEDSASAAGLPRHPAETAAEYTIRVLHTWDIAPEALGGLAELYREARYSRHSITERHREQAIARLTTIHEDLQRVVDEAAAQAALAEAEAAARTVPGP
ncbi:MAG: DUF4129 domain-containing protein [Lapillicoccus sp.]